MPSRRATSALQSLSRSTRTNGGIGLGMTAAKVRRLLGATTESSRGHLVFTSEAEVTMTPAQKKAFQADARPDAGPALFRFREVRVELERGRVTASRASQITST